MKQTNCNQSNSWSSKKLRKSYLEFFKSYGHEIIPSASLLPDNDPTVLFTTAGMHPLVPYLLGEKHPLGRRLVDCQKCIRTDDIEEVGDETHLTFFEMLGNWSLGDYFKRESITMSYEFLTLELGIPKERLAVTVFEGDDSVPRDVETHHIWSSLGLRENQIFFYGRKENWWGPAGQTGPCGPDSEIFYDNGCNPCSDQCGPACNCGKYVEIWNNVFMEYKKEGNGTYTLLSQKNVDTGMGLERILAILNNKNSVFETDLFLPLIMKLEDLMGIKILNEINNMNSAEETMKQFRIIADHMRSITFLLADDKGIIPSNTEQGYILRRLIRRTLRLLKKCNINQNVLPEFAEIVILNNQEEYPELVRNRDFIFDQLKKEYHLFRKTLDSGLKKAEQFMRSLEGDRILSGDLAFKLYDTYGFPIELTIELAEEYGASVDLFEFNRKYKEHQEKSRVGAEGKFKGGLADQSERTARLHTATHLLNGALRIVLGNTVYQKGSNINADRLRFDFSFDRKLTEEELQKVEQIVNEAIDKDIPVICEELTTTEAKDQGAIGVFDHKYEQRVKVYTIQGYSKEICGGPHASKTSELKHFTILKEESSSAGVRRIKASIQED
ncbi:MAG: Alanine--tRNA ligase [Herbinix sp.]|jgi:alanyl-tRNA synthetase|nr:Alanine--tRNA ligase [Herbinix sp.]